MARLIAIALLAVLIAPGTWVRSTLPEPDLSQTLSLTSLDVDGYDLGAVELVSAWHLESPNAHFGSYSALLAMPDCTFLSASDAGKLLSFPIPGCDGEIVIGRFAGRSEIKKALIDIESLTRDPVSGRIWVGYEGTNTIERFEKGLKASESVRPAAMRNWSSNSGPESMVRLSNGHFVAISEGRDSYWDSDYPAVLFEGDPMAEPGVRKFSFEPPEGYRPVDMAQLPDGRVLVLVRQFVLGLPPSFNVKLVLVDPANIETGEVWRGQEIGAITDPRIKDNYEGLAIVGRDDDLLDLWVISDDNGTSFQRTMLLKLAWDPRSPDEEKARENPARPSKSSD